MKHDWPVIDLFSGAGGMSLGFHARPPFRLIGAADAQAGKPSSPPDSLDCNTTYAANIGITPVGLDLADVTPTAWPMRSGSASATTWPCWLHAPPVPASRGP